MSEHPILFSAPMVRAILAGEKTQTRRIAKLPPWFREEYPRHGAHEIRTEIGCPYGAPGDRLWVRETWQGVPWNAGAEKRVPGNDHDEQGVRYRATWDRTAFKHWRPSIFMRRADSRIDLDVAAVRVERLQDITDEDIRDEGVTPELVRDMLTGRARRYMSPVLRCASGCRFHPDAQRYRAAWQEGWDAINGKRAPWASNPWVWVVSFKRAA